MEHKADCYHRAGSSYWNKKASLDGLY